MLKSIILFYRKKKIKINSLSERLLQIPDFGKSPTITILIDGKDKKNVDRIGCIVKTFLNPESVRFVILGKLWQSDFVQGNVALFIRKKDYNIVGVLKKEKEDLLNTFAGDMLINLSDNNALLLNDYLISCINSSFKIGHSKVNIDMHDLVIDYGEEKSNLERIKILSKYLMMLSGGNNEK